MESVLWRNAGTSAYQSQEAMLKCDKIHCITYMFSLTVSGYELFEEPSGTSVISPLKIKIHGLNFMQHDKTFYYYQSSDFFCHIIFIFNHIINADYYSHLANIHTCSTSAVSHKSLLAPILCYTTKTNRCSAVVGKSQSRFDLNRDLTAISDSIWQ